MAGGRRMDLSLATAGSPGAKEEAAVDRRSAASRALPALYAELAALLPDLPSRATRTDIVGAAVEHVKVLEDTVAVLEAYRAVRGGGGGAEVSSDSSREAVFFSARLPAARRPGALTRVLEAFDRRGVEVLAATLARGGEGEAAAVVTVTAAAAAPEVVKMIKADIAAIE